MPRKPNKKLPSGPYRLENGITVASIGSKFGGLKGIKRKAKTAAHPITTLRQPVVIFIRSTRIPCPPLRKLIRGVRDRSTLGLPTWGVRVRLRQRIEVDIPQESAPYWTFGMSE